jgi:hypothetical protein
MLDSNPVLGIQYHIRAPSDKITYLGGFIGEPAAFSQWLDGKIQHWSTAVAGLVLAAAKFPQSAYSGLFVQTVIKDIGETFPGIEKEMTQTFLSSTLFDDTIDSDDPCLALACLPVKHAG